MLRRGRVGARFGSGLLIRSFVALNRVTLAFRPDNVLVADTSVQTESGLQGWRRATSFYKRVLPEVRHIPGVRATGAMLVPPGGHGPRGSVWGDFLPADKQAPFAGFAVIAPGTFAALSVPQLRGRDFDDRDSYDATFTVIVNQAFVRKAFPSQDPLGHAIFCGLDDSKHRLIIVGVVGDFRQYGPATEPLPEIYLPYEQHPNNATSLKLIVRTAGDPHSFSAPLRRTLRAESPEVSVKFTTLQALLDENLSAPRFRTLLLAIFAGLAICLAMAGVYGVLAYVVAQRRNEIGLRMALGADRRDVLRLVVRQGVALAAIGLAFGLAGSVWAAKVLTSVLYDIKPGDRLTYAAVVGFLGLAVFTILLIPSPSF